MGISMATRKFPQYLSKPFQILWFELDEVLVFFFFLTMALIYGKWLWLGFVVAQYSYSKTKRNQTRGFLKHMLYVLGLVQLKNYPDYFTQEFHE
jgi:type IV conjugative transfer system protein TraL